MSLAAKASIAFGVYAVLFGAILVFVPNLALPLFLLPTTEEPWVHVVGAIAVAIGAYYVQAGRHELVPFFRASIGGRMWFAIATTAVALVWDLPGLIVFAAIDAVTAGITAWALTQGGDGAVARG